jgi:hypothetical protein
MSPSNPVRDKVLTDSVRVLGKQHPDTLNARASLAISYGQAWRF